MSYHVQQQPQQKSFGIFIVIAFHIALIWAFFNAFGSHLISPPSEAIKINSLPQTPPVDPPLTITTPIVNTTVTIQVEHPDPFTFEENHDKLPTSDAGVDTGTGGTVLSSPIKPKAIRTTLPEYPLASKRLGEEGVTGLRLFITAEGKITDVQLDSSSGYSRLDDAALKHVARYWAYTPCTQNDKPVACWFTTKLRWKLESERR